MTIVNCSVHVNCLPYLINPIIERDEIIEHTLHLTSRPSRTLSAHMIAPEYAKDIMQVESRKEVKTRASSQYFESHCISAKLLTGTSCDLIPMFYTVAIFFILECDRDNTIQC